MDEIKRLLPDEVFTEAASVLEAVAKTPDQKRLYEARLKFQRDEAARALASEISRKEGREEGREEGRVEGREEGIEIGELFGRIKTLQWYFGATESTREELSECSEEQLKTLLKQLQDQLRNRNV
ncbi:MAG: hypothetical protein WCH39_08875 [Schlesneria sp.]|jgi:hypothetical protein